MAKVWIEGSGCDALLDTGATISAVSEKYYRESLQHLPLCPIDDLIEVECGNGGDLQYIGYVEAELQVSGAGLSTNEKYLCPLLVSKDTKFNSMVPLLLGTNLLEPMMAKTKEQNGLQFLQSAQLTTPWYLSFRSMILQEQQLCRNKGTLALVRYAQITTTIKPNTTVIITGRLDRAIDYRPTLALLQPALSKDLDGLLDVTPTVMNYLGKKTGFVDVHIANVTTQTVVLPSWTVLCEVQPVTRADPAPAEGGEDIDASGTEHMNTTNINESTMSSDEMKRLDEFLGERAKNFSSGPKDTGHTKRVQHEINMTNETPFKERHRRIPPGMFEEIREHLRQMLESGIIRPSKSSFSSNMVWVRKRCGALRPCVDFRILNARTVKDSYALPRIDEMLDSLAGSKYFSVLDLKSGYHQVEIKEAHKARTAFTVAPLGFYEYNRMAMGLADAPATYQRLMEDCLGDLHLNICLVFLDDIIIFSDTFDEHLERLDRVMRRLTDAGLKLNPKKCHFMKDKVRCVGHIVSAEGVEADPQKCEKVKNWPTPQNAEEV